MNSDIFSQTKTKYIESYFKGTPELNNIYGSLNNLLKKILTEPYNSQEVIEVSSLENNLILTLSIGHGFLQNQVIILEGASNSELNIEYRVVEVSSVSITVRSPLPDPIETLTQESITISGAPLGYSVCYENLDEGILCIKNTNKESPAILRVIDKIPPNEYGTNWSKYGRVTIGQHITEEGTFVDNIKAPFHPGFPYAEETGNDVKGEGGIHGFAKWYYSAAKGHTFTETGVPNGIYPTDWRIIGDDKTFYLFVKTQGLDYSWFNLYSFGNYVSNREQDSDNIILHASFRWKTASASTESYTYSSGDNTFTKMSSSESCCLFKSSLGSYTQNFLGSHFGLDSGGTAAERDYPSLNTKNISGISSNTGQFLLSPLYIKDSTLEYRGQLRGITQFYGVGQIKELTYFDGDSVVLSAEGYYNSSNYSDNNKIPYLFSFKDWEYV